LLQRLRQFRSEQVANRFAVQGHERGVVHQPSYPVWPAVRNLADDRATEPLPDQDDRVGAGLRDGAEHSVYIVVLGDL
jgi:hypothetical protein